MNLSSRYCYLANFIPLLVFVLIFVGSGLCFFAIRSEDYFYQLSPLTAIFFSVILGFILHKGTVSESMNAFLSGCSNHDILMMCIIFLLAGIFTAVTESIGSISSVVGLALSIISPDFLLIGVFLGSASLATAIGSSMGTIATLSPVVVAISMQGAFDPSLGAATVVGGAMFGDNLSIISDTTIAALSSQSAQIKDKLKLNGKVALVSAILTVIVLFFSDTASIPIVKNDYSLILLMPYVLLVALSLFRVNVCIAIVLAIILALVIGTLNGNYNIFLFNSDLKRGLASMQEIVLLSLMIGGLSGFLGNSSKKLATEISAWTAKHNSKKLAQFVIIKIVSIYDILLANNTIAIILSGDIAREIAKQHKIPSYYAASWLDVFSCVFQGVIPYGAQILLASSIFGISALRISSHVYYCYILGIITIAYILIFKVEDIEDASKYQSGHRV